MARAADPASVVADRSALAAVGRVLAAIGGARFELQPVLDQIAAEARVLCAADAAFCFLRDEDTFRFVAASGGDPAHWEYDRTHPDPIDRRSIVGRVALSGGPVQIPDLAEDPEYEASGYQVGGYRTLLGVPIGSDDDLVGAFGLGRFSVDPFTEDEITLVSLFADQAAVAIRLAGLLTETHEALQRQSAVGEVLQSIASSEIDLPRVLQTVIEKATRLSHADEGNMIWDEGGRFRVAAYTEGVPAAFREVLSQRLFIPERGTLTGRVLMEHRPVQIEDALNDPDYEFTEAQQTSGFRSLLGVPVMRNGEPFGVLAVWRRRVEPFTEQEIGLVTTFADQVGIAVRLVSLLTDTSEALERESAIATVLASIARSSFDLQRVLDTVTESAVRLSSADSGNLALIADGRYRIAASAGEKSRELRRIFDESRIALDRGSLVGRVTMERRTIQIPDVLADAEYAQLEMQRVVGFRTLLGVPLMRDDNPAGVLIMQRNEVQPFSEKEIGLVQTFADQAVLAIANVELYETVERQRAALASFAPHVAGLLSSPEGEALLTPHRREISALFCDLRGFTAFAETAEPEELFSVLREYHAAVGEVAIGHGGMVEHYAGDGFMLFFNDPTPVPDHPMAAIRTALDLRERFEDLAAGWHRRGYELGLGIGISVGYATLGRIGFEGRYDYAGVGAVSNLAARLSSAAAAGEILVSQRLQAAVEDVVITEPVEALTLKGFSHPVTAYRLLGVRAAATT